MRVFLSHRIPGTRTRIGVAIPVRLTAPPAVAVLAFLALTAVFSTIFYEILTR